MAAFRYSSEMIFLLLWVAILFSSANSAPAPLAEGDVAHSQALEHSEAGASRCYYNFQHYEEGDRIVTNEPCLNCTCHKRMLMCYLRVCPFTKAIGQDCTIEKKPDQCCPVITCPEVPVDILTSSTTPASASTALGSLNNYGCRMEDNTFYPDGVQMPADPKKPCELCYCIRNHTTCVRQECTLNVEGCRPIYQEGVCCPVRYDCDYNEIGTTERPSSGGLLLGSTPSPLQCRYDDTLYNDGELIESSQDKPCESCYCMRGDIVCAVRSCGEPMEGKGCEAVPPPEGQCCPTTYQCANETVAIEALATESSIFMQPADSQEGEPENGSESDASDMTPDKTSADQEEPKPEPDTVLPSADPDKDDEKVVDDKIGEQSPAVDEHIESDPTDAEEEDELVATNPEHDEVVENVVISTDNPKEVSEEQQTSAPSGISGSSESVSVSGDNTVDNRPTEESSTDAIDKTEETKTESSITYPEKEDESKISATPENEPVTHEEESGSISETEEQASNVAQDIKPDDVNVNDGNLDDSVQTETQTASSESVNNIDEPSVIPTNQNTNDNDESVPVKSEDKIDNELPEIITEKESNGVSDPEDNKVNEESSNHIKPELHDSLPEASEEVENKPDDNEQIKDEVNKDDVISSTTTNEVHDSVPEASEENGNKPEESNITEKDNNKDEETTTKSPQTSEGEIHSEETDSPNQNNVLLQENVAPESPVTLDQVKETEPINVDESSGVQSHVHDGDETTGESEVTAGNTNIPDDSNSEGIKESPDTTVTVGNENTPKEPIPPRKEDSAPEEIDHPLQHPEGSMTKAEDSVPSDYSGTETQTSVAEESNNENVKPTDETSQQDISEINVSNTVTSTSADPATTNEHNTESHEQDLSLQTEIPIEETPSSPSEPTAAVEQELNEDQKVSTENFNSDPSSNISPDDDTPDEEKKPEQIANENDSKPSTHDSSSSDTAVPYIVVTESEEGSNSNVKPEDQPASEPITDDGEPTVSNVQTEDTNGHTPDETSTDKNLSSSDDKPTSDIIDHVSGENKPLDEQDSSPTDNKIAPDSEETSTNNDILTNDNDGADKTIVHSVEEHDPNNTVEDETLQNEGTNSPAEVQTESTEKHEGDKDVQEHVDANVNPEESISESTETQSLEKGSPTESAPIEESASDFTAHVEDNAQEEPVIENEVHESKPDQQDQLPTESHETDKTNNEEDTETNEFPEVQHDPVESDTIDFEDQHTDHEHFDHDSPSNNEIVDDVHHGTGGSIGHDSPASLPGPVGVIPGEGDCLVEGITYTNNSQIPSKSPCHKSCTCMSSIVHCQGIDCPPPPPQLANCMPVHQGDLCCPVYTCDGETPLSPESHNQMGEPEISSESPVSEGNSDSQHVENAEPTSSTTQDKLSDEKKPEQSSIDDSVATVDESVNPVEESVLVTEATETIHPEENPMTSGDNVDNEKQDSIASEKESTNVETDIVQTNGNTAVPSVQSNDSEGINSAESNTEREQSADEEIQKVTEPSPAADSVASENQSSNDGENAQGETEGSTTDVLGDNKTESEVPNENNASELNPETSYVDNKTDTPLVDATPEKENAPHSGDDKTNVSQDDHTSESENSLNSEEGVVSHGTSDIVDQTPAATAEEINPESSTNYDNLVNTEVVLQSEDDPSSSGNNDNIPHSDSLPSVHEPENESAGESVDDLENGQHVTEKVEATPDVHASEDNQAEPNKPADSSSVDLSPVDEQGQTNDDVTQEVSTVEEQGTAADSLPKEPEVHVSDDAKPEEPSKISEVSSEGELIKEEEASGPSQNQPDVNLDDSEHNTESQKDTEGVKESVSEEPETSSNNESEHNPEIQTVEDTEQQKETSTDDADHTGISESEHSTETQKNDEEEKNNSSPDEAHLNENVGGESESTEEHPQMPTDQQTPEALDESNKEHTEGDIQPTLSSIPNTPSQEVAENTLGDSNSEAEAEQTASGNEGIDHDSSHNPENNGDVTETVNEQEHEISTEGIVLEGDHLPESHTDGIKESEEPISTEGYDKEHHADDSNNRIGEGSEKEPLHEEENIKEHDLDTEVATPITSSSNSNEDSNPEADQNESENAASEPITPANSEHGDVTAQSHDEKNEDTSEDGAPVAVDEPTDENNPSVNESESPVEESDKTSENSETTSDGSETNVLLPSDENNEPQTAVEDVQPEDGKDKIQDNVQESEGQVHSEGMPTEANAHGGEGHENGEQSAQEGGHEISPITVENTAQEDNSPHEEDKPAEEDGELSQGNVKPTISEENPSEHGVDKPVDSAHDSEESIQVQEGVIHVEDKPVSLDAESHISEGGNENVSETETDNKIGTEPSTETPNIPQSTNEGTNSQESDSAHIPDHTDEESEHTISDKEQNTSEPNHAIFESSPQESGSNGNEKLPDIVSEETGPEQEHTPQVSEDKPSKHPTPTLPESTQHNEEEPKPETSDTDIPTEDQFPTGGDMDYDVSEDGAFGPGTCRYGGKVYVSAQQIPRDDPCDFCFCFRSDIICLQQSCPPPIHRCHQEPIQGYCCPRYQCPVSMATSLNLTTTTTTTTTTLPPHFFAHAYHGAARQAGCLHKGRAYSVGEEITTASGPCLQCICGSDGQMKCDPVVCSPEPMLRKMMEAAVSHRRR